MIDSNTADRDAMHVLHRRPAAAGGIAVGEAAADISGARDQTCRMDEVADQVPATAISLGGSLRDKLTFINAHKLAGSRPVYVSAPSETPGAGLSVRPATASSTTTTSSGSVARWVQPSGPRRPGEGTENEEQGIISAERTTDGVVTLRITLLAAGFVIGPAGSTVREIMRMTGSDIKSWTEGASRSRPSARRTCRVFLIEGEDHAVVAAMDIITAAVDRYKELCEGRCQGQSVPRLQRVMGVDFSYQPPPRSVVPFAAALKGNVTRPPPKPEDYSGGMRSGGAASMLPLLPGYIMPIAGGFLPPGSPPGTLPFPMYLPQLGLGPFPTDMPMDMSGMNMNMGMGMGMGMGGPDPGLYTGGPPATPLTGASVGLDADLLGRGGGAPGSSWALPPLPNPYGYHAAGLDSASVMAYMSLLMPQSPARYPGGMDPAGVMGAYGMGMPSPITRVIEGFGLQPPAPASPPRYDGNGAQSASPGTAATTDMAGSAYTHVSPSPAGAAPHALRDRNDPATAAAVPPPAPGAAGMTSPPVVVSSEGAAGLPGSGLTTGSAAPVPFGGAFGCWYPPSPNMASMPLAPMAVAMGPMPVGGPMPLPMPGMAMHTHATCSPPRPCMVPQGSMSPSRLNPLAPPWASPTTTHTSSGSGASNAQQHREPAPAGAMSSGLGDAGGTLPASAPPTAADVITAANHAASSAVAAAVNHASRTGGIAAPGLRVTATGIGAGDSMPDLAAMPPRTSPALLQMTADEPLTPIAASVLAMGKTPKRPVTTVPSGPLAHRRSSAGTTTTTMATPAACEPPSSGLALVGQVPSTAGGEEAGESSGGACHRLILSRTASNGMIDAGAQPLAAAPAGSGEVGTPTTDRGHSPALVSSGDPLISPSRFSRGFPRSAAASSATARGGATTAQRTMRRPRSQGNGLQPEGLAVGAPAPGATPLAELLHQLQLRGGDPRALGGA